MSDMADHDRPPSSEPLAEVRTNSTDTGRVNQKLRTRQALIDAARGLVDEGATPTLAEVADRALVSKTTAYRYFASAEDLIAEVYFDRVFPTIDDALGDLGDEGADPTERVLAVEQAVNGALLAHETAMRVIVRNSIDAALAADEAPARPGRRQALITAAVEPLEDAVDPAILRRLRHGLALVIGPEAIIAARDVCGLDPEETRSLTTWAATALVARTLADAGAAPDEPRA